MTGELKPCPFCGSDKVNVMVRDFVFCGGCGAFGPDDDPYGAKWNSTPRLSEIDAALAELEGFCATATGEDGPMLVALCADIAQKKITALLRPEQKDSQ